MQLQIETALIEAILFLETEPISVQSLVKISKLSKEVVMLSLAQLEEEYKQDSRGIELLHLEDTCQLIPKQRLWQQLKARYGKASFSKLSKAAMETLSIIAYSQPVTKSELESIRGVSSDSMVKLLLSQKLIKEIGRKEAVGRPIQYGTTEEFLKWFQLKSIADLPKLDDVDRSQFEQQDDD